MKCGWGPLGTQHTALDSKLMPSASSLGEGSSQGCELRNSQREALPVALAGNGGALPLACLGRTASGRLPGLLLPEHPERRGLATGEDGMTALGASSGEGDETPPGSVSWPGKGVRSGHAWSGSTAPTGPAPHCALHLVQTDEDKSIMVAVEHDGPGLHGRPECYFQAALLYTTPQGERYA